MGSGKMVGGFDGWAGPSLSGGGGGGGGAQGAQGFQGFQGFQGSAGGGGAQGSQGSIGAQGAIGAQGTAGTVGAQGSQGTAGAQGFQGTSGTAGAQGAQGLQGSQGATGTQGSQGSQGSQGTTTFTPKQGGNLTDADQTIQPGTDSASQYVQATNITASRTKTLGVTSVTTDALVEIVRTDTGAFTLVVVNGGTNGGTLFTFPASPTVKQGFTAFFNGVDWVAVGYTYYS